MNIESYVSNILNDIKNRKEEALKEYSKKFDNYDGDFKVSYEEFDEAEKLIPEYDKEIIKKAYDRIYNNHLIQKNNDKLRFYNGSIYGIIYKPINRIGIYIPGKKPLPSTIMMVCAPAKIAGVKDIIITVAPDNGKINPYVLYIAKFLGINNVYKLGGIQAIAAMAYGISMEKVDKIFGPGNIYVNEAKRQLYGITGIDGLYGPSEICVISDENSNNNYIISDLNSQLEHGETSKAWLLTTDKNIENKIDNKKIEVCVFNNMDLLIKKVNEIAPEHLEILCKEPLNLLNKIENAGAIYIGDYTPVPAGDYFIGVNHLLPTGKTSKFSSVLTVDDFMKKTSFAYTSRSDFINDSYLGIRLAEIENMELHKKSMVIRK